MSQMKVDRRGFLTATGSALALAGCGGAHRDVASIRVNSSTHSMVVGETWQAVATAYDGGGHETSINSMSWTWTSSDASVVKVGGKSRTATLTAVAPGEATITVHEYVDDKLAHINVTVAAASENGGES